MPLIKVMSAIAALRSLVVLIRPDGGDCGKSVSVEPEAKDWGESGGDGALGGRGMRSLSEPLLPYANTKVALRLEHCQEGRQGNARLLCEMTGNKSDGPAAPSWESECR